MLMRAYASERFLERLSVSPYRTSLVLKGGTLVAAIVGLEARSTMDIDTAISGISLDEDKITETIEDICAVDLDDGMGFEISNIDSIMGDSDYPGPRVSMKASPGRILIPMKLDFSAGDVITPQSLDFDYGLMFEDRTISIAAYNLETLLAEKLETIVSRGVANTRMRDFYDIYIVTSVKGIEVDYGVLQDAFAKTCAQRDTSSKSESVWLAFLEVKSSAMMSELWDAHRKKQEHAAGVAWDEVLAAAEKLLGIVVAR